MRRVAIGAVVAAVALTPAVPSAAQAAPGDARYLVILEESVADPGRAAADHARQYGSEAQSVYSSVNGYSALMTATEAAAVAADPAGQYVVPDGVFARVDREPPPGRCQKSGPLASQCLPEDVDRIDGELSSTRSGNGGGSVGTNIAVLDTGVDRTHPDLDVVGGVDCSTGTPVTGPSAFHDVIGHG